MADETGWLIERNDRGMTQWLVVGPSPRSTSWTELADKATRFSREIDATAFWRWYENSDPALRITAHGWMETLTDDDASRADRVMQVFARYQRELMKGGNASSPGRDETLIIAASLTAAHFSATDQLEKDSTR